MKQYPDISWFQSGLSLAQLRAAGYDTVCLRASCGSGFRDSAFPGWWQQAAALGFRRIAYHFLYENSAAVEAANFLGAVESADGFRPGDLVMSDMETLGDPNPVSGCARGIGWHEIVHGRYPTVGQTAYGNAWYLQDGGFLPGRLPNVGIIVAAYPNGSAPYQPADTSRPGLPRGWDHACAWQFTSVARVPGWGAGVDMNALTCPSDLAHLSGKIDPHQVPLLPAGAWPVIGPGRGTETQVGAMRRLLTVAGYPDADDHRPLDLIDANRIGKLQRDHKLKIDGLFGPASLYAALGIHQSSATSSAWPTMTPGVAVTHPYQLRIQRTLLNRAGMWDTDDGRPWSADDLSATKRYQEVVNLYAGQHAVNPSGICDATTLTYLLGCTL
jgi:hypothetical protein